MKSWRPLTAHESAMPKLSAPTFLAGAFGGLPKRTQPVVYRDLRRELPGTEAARECPVPGFEAGFTGI